MGNLSGNHFDKLGVTLGSVPEATIDGLGFADITVQVNGPAQDAARGDRLLMQLNSNLVVHGFSTFR